MMQSAQGDLASSANCSVDLPCIRFCNESFTTAFNISVQPGSENFKSGFKAVYGRPCQHLYALEPEDYPDETWTFLAVSHINLCFSL